ncbi:MAG: Rpn family recombination-promoting nuclease/putative transposase, partial [Clostridia bacterium]|nr:Rpn family recombination-promoting nuclease/putative transposase [Clostridia bacterium]
MGKENYEEKAILQPKNDVVFQTLFGRGKENITKAMLEDILKIKIHKLDLDKGKDLVNDNKNDKNGRVDLRAIINDNIECDIEIQLSTHEKMVERFLYYWAKMYTANLLIGSKYNKLRKTISIIIIDDEIKQFKGIHKAHTRWQLRDEEYKNIILTNFCEISIIELPKAIKEYQKNKQNEMLQWMMFLDNPENKEVAEIMEENE